MPRKFLSKKLKPEYNISLNPIAPFSGRTHSEESKIIMSEAKKGENHPNYGQTLSNETKTKISDTMTGENHPMYPLRCKNHTKETKIIMSDAKKGEKNPMYNKPKPEGSGRSSQSIEVTDVKNNTTTCYDSIREAVRELNLPNPTIISNYIKNNQQKPYKGKYTFKKIQEG